MKVFTIIHIKFLHVIEQSKSKLNHMEFPLLICMIAFFKVTPCNLWTHTISKCYGNYFRVHETPFFKSWYNGNYWKLIFINLWICGLLKRYRYTYWHMIFVIHVRIVNYISNCSCLQTFSYPTIFLNDYSGSFTYLWLWL